jgi:uncharacterized protein YoaH (UPF0181 family)
MTFLIDNLIAIVVGSVLLSGLLVLQHRQQQTAIEATQRYRAQSFASDLTATVEREIENARSRAETERAFAIGAGGQIGPATYRFRLRRDATDAYTELLEFPTASDPDALNASGTMIVSYRVTPTGDSARVDGAVVPLLSLARYEYHRGGRAVHTGTYHRVLDFDVVALTGASLDGGMVSAAEILETVPPRVSLTVVFAPESAGVRASDQAAAPVHSLRFGRSVRIPGANALPGTVPVDLDVEGGIPDDIPALVPPAPSESGGGESRDTGARPTDRDVNPRCRFLASC